MDGHDCLSLHKVVHLGYVCVAGEMENDEENYQEWLLHQQHHSAITIPNSLPLKMREILVELSLVEEEINRLERQIKAVKAGAQKSKRAHMQSNSDKWQHSESSSNNEKVPPFEMKALHFICRAIKGDYKFSDFKTNHKAINSSTLSNQKEKKPTCLLRQKLIKLRSHTPGKHRALEIPRNSWRKVTSTPLHSEEDHKCTPNKLSENIMKCLILIFMRFLRTSKEKSRIIFQKHQDPYGIFDSKESIARDIGPYKNLIIFTSTSMDFNCIHSSGFLPLFQRLKILIDGLRKVDLRLLSHQQKLAFWINMHNACIMHGYLQFGLPSVSSHDKIPTLIKQATLNISGDPINAQTIERFILRKTSDSVDKQIFHTKEKTVQQLYGLKTPDPNITFALCCGTRSSPQVKIYTAECVTSELEKSKVEYLEAAIMVKNTKRIALPELLLKNMHDFGQDLCPLMEWLCRHLPPSGSLRKSIVEYFGRHLHGGMMSAVVEIIPYDFEFQYLFAV